MRQHDRYKKKNNIHVNTLNAIHMFGLREDFSRKKINSENKKFLFVLFNATILISTTEFRCCDYCCSLLLVCIIERWMLLTWTTAPKMSRDSSTVWICDITAVTGQYRSVIH